MSSQTQNQNQNAVEDNSVGTKRKVVSVSTDGNAADGTTTTTESTFAPIATSSNVVLKDKIDWRILSKPGPDLKLIFGDEERIIPGTLFNQFVKPGPYKKEAFYLNFETRPFEKATGIRFRNANTPDGLTVESPLLKVKYGLKDSEKYPGSYSMKFNIDSHALDTKDEVSPFMDFLEMVDNSLKQYIIANAFEWLKEVDACKSHVMVDRHRDTKNKMYTDAWKKGDYTQQQYEADCSEFIEGAIRNDGSGTLLHVKVGAVMKGKEKALPVRPDVVLFKNGTTPITYSSECEIAQNGKCYVQCVMNLNRISFAKNKFFITWSCGVANYVPETDVDPNTEGHKETSYQFDGTSSAVKIPVHHKNTEATTE